MEHPEYEHRPVTMQEFLTNPTYTPPEDNRRPHTQNLLVDFFDGGNMETMGDYEEMLYIAGIGCHAKGTELLMYDGSMKRVEDITVGDYLMGDDSKPRKVRRLIRGKEKMYKITPIKGEPFVVNENHVLSLKRTNKGIIAKNGRRDQLANTTVNLTVKEYLQLSTKMKGILKLYKAPVKFSENKQLLSIDPYFLGLWLGDGLSNKVGITTQDKEIFEYTSGVAADHDLKITVNQNKGKSCPTYVITTQKNTGRQHNNTLLNKFKELDLIDNKHIPHIYKTASRNSRLKLLAGLIDTDGYVGKNRNMMSFSNKNEQLIDDVLFLCRSLGLAAYKTERFTSYDKIKKFKSFRISISGDLNLIPTRLPRKQCRPRLQKKNVLYTGFSVEYIGIDSYYGFNLDSNHLYLDKNFIVHHNSGKSFTYSLAAKYILYRLLCLKNPQQQYKLGLGTRLALINIATSYSQAKDVVFGEFKNRIDNSPWFQKYYPPDPRIKSVLRFPKNIYVLPVGSNEEAPLGYNIFSAAIDEASFHISTKDKDYAEESYNQIKKRIRSRFLDHGKLFIITSPRYVHDFAEKKYREDDNPRLYKKRTPLWEAIPEEYYKGEYFDVAKYLPQYEGKNIKAPVEYEQEFIQNPERAMRDFGAQPSMSIQGFFRDSDIIPLMANKERKHPVGANGKFINSFKNPRNSAEYDPDPRYIHVDLGLNRGNKGDAAGIAMGKFNGWDLKKKPDGTFEKRAKIHIDYMERITSGPRGEILFSDIRKIIYELKDMGYNIETVTFDGWNSVDSIQTLKESGFKADVLSVDKTLQPYYTLKAALLEGRLDFYKYEPFITETQQLEEVNGKKIDHPHNGCFTGDTRVALLDGSQPTLKELSDKYDPGDEIFVYTIMKDGSIGCGTGYNPRKTGYREIIEIELDNFQIIRCTPEHKFMLLDGSYIEAQNLTREMSLMPLYRSIANKGGWLEYEKYWCPKDKKRKLTHQMVYQQYNTGKPEIVHHKDHNKRNNVPSNLEGLTKSEHASYHTKMRHREDKDYHNKVKTAVSNYAKSKIGRETSRQNMRNLNELRNIGKGHSGNHKILSIKPGGYADVYDLTVKETHNFALTSGVFVHNSKDVADAVAGVCYHVSKKTPGSGVLGA